MRKEIQELIDSCYSGNNPDYPKLSAFEPGKFLNKLLPYLKAEIKKSRLTDDEIDQAFEDTFETPVTFDHKPTVEEIFALKLGSVAQAQIDEIIKLLEEK